MSSVARTRAKALGKTPAGRCRSTATQVKNAHRTPQEAQALYRDRRQRVAPLPRAPEWLEVTDFNRDLVHFHIDVLHVVDVVVSKLKRFQANDLRDIEAMVDRDLVPHAVLIERFRSAVDGHLLDARAEDLSKYVATTSGPLALSVGRRRTDHPSLRR
jgi:hypothetical protein